MGKCRKSRDSKILQKPLTKKPEITESRQLEHVEIKGKRRNRLSFASPQQRLRGTILLISNVMPTAVFHQTDQSSYQLCTRAWTS